MPPKNATAATRRGTRQHKTLSKMVPMHQLPESWRPVVKLEAVMPRELLRANATPFDEGYDAEADALDAQRLRHAEELNLNDYLLNEAARLAHNLGPTSKAMGLAKREIASVLAKVWRESRRLAAQHIEQGVEPPPW